KLDKTQPLGGLTRPIHTPRRRTIFGNPRAVVGLNARVDPLDLSTSKPTTNVGSLKAAFHFFFAARRFLAASAACLRASRPGVVGMDTIKCVSRVKMTGRPFDTVTRESSAAE